MSDDKVYIFTDKYIGAAAKLF